MGGKQLEQEFSDSGDHLSGYDRLCESWIGQAGKVPHEILRKLGASPTFQQYVGISLLAQSPDAIRVEDRTAMWNHVASGFAATDALLNSNFWTNYQRGHSFIHPSVALKETESFLTAELKLRTLLLTQLLNHRGHGYAIEFLAEKFMRAGELASNESEIRLRDDIATTNMRVYIKCANGETFSPDSSAQREALLYWDARQWTNALTEKRVITESDETTLSDQFTKHGEAFRDADGNWYIFTRGVIYVPPKEKQEEAGKWSYYEWRRHIEEYIRELNSHDAAFIETEMAAGRLPYVSVDFEIDENTPMSAIPPWGSLLVALPTAEIHSLAKGGFCDPSCQQYHGKAKEQKELGELIAPVDARLFAGELMERYSHWEKKSDSDRFKVLIPAQADETTIMGIIDNLEAAGVGRDEIRRNISFVLADLCPTPLLSVYAHLRERDLLETANIVSMDVFNWADPMEEKFNFVGADHFIDLFPQDGDFSQTRVLKALINALENDGKLILTARCGTGDGILTKDDVMEIFTTVCKQKLEELTRELEQADASDGPLYDGKYKGIFPAKQDLARGIYALASYLTLRDVNPIANMESLKQLLSHLQDDSGNSFSYNVQPLVGKKDKVAIIIQKRES